LFAAKILGRRAPVDFPVWANEPVLRSIQALSLVSGFVMPVAEEPEMPSDKGKRRSLPVIIVGSVMFSFISYWRVAAVVLCDMASTMFYIGGIVEQVIGPAAPWFILAVMLFSFAMGFVYIESCALFVRGGVYRVVKEAIGGLPAKAAVSALLFDYVLTGPISACSAGQYLIGWILELVAVINPELAIDDPAVRADIRQYGSVVIAVAITLYFFRKNLIGIHESSGKALRIMFFTTAVVVLALVWSVATLVVRGPANSIPRTPDFRPKVEFETVEGPNRVTGEVREMWLRNDQGALVPKVDEQGNPVPKVDPISNRQVDPLGFLPHVMPDLAENLRAMGAREGETNWLSIFGVLGLIMAFGHAVLAMSGEETMAQVYREVESPKLKNFKKGAFVIFTYALVMTTSVSFLAVALIPDEVRMKDYADNLLGGLSMHVIGPPTARLVLNALVVAAGFLILSGAVNTSIIGSNGVLNRVAEDGVLPDRLQKPHPKYGTTHRILYLIAGMQLFTIIATRGNMILLGEAYAFGVLWSFTFNAMSMFVLRFKDKSEREFKVPLNIKLGKFEAPIGLGLVFVILATAALCNLFTKELATISGLLFTTIFLGVFTLTERYTKQNRRGLAHEHVEQFTETTTEGVSIDSIHLTKPHRKLVAIRSPQNLYMLQRALDETDPESTDVIVMTAKVVLPGDDSGEPHELDRYDRKLMTAVIELAEKAGKQIRPLVVPTNNPLHGVMRTAQSLAVQELIVGASNKFTVEEHLDQMVFYWINLHGGAPTPLTIRVISRTYDVINDVGGGNRIPRITERQARTVGELRAAGIGVRRVVMLHDNTHHSHDLFESVLTMLDPEVALALVYLKKEQSTQQGGSSTLSLAQDVLRAEKVGRVIEVHELAGEPGTGIVRLAIENDYDLIILDESSAEAQGTGRPDWYDYVREHASCPVCFVSLPSIPREVVDTTPSTPNPPGR
jgi:amino acid transporter